MANNMLVSRLLYAQKQWVLTKEYNPKQSYATFVVNPGDFPGNDVQRFWSKNANVTFVRYLKAIRNLLPDATAPCLCLCVRSAGATNPGLLLLQVHLM